MEKVKFSNGKIFEIPVNGIHSTDEALRVSFLAPESDLVELETMFSDKANMEKVQLLAENDEVLRIYSGYSKLVGIEKKKNVTVGTNYEEVTVEVTESPEGEALETPVETIETITTPIVSDVVQVTLKKEDETMARLVALEGTVDVLVLDILGM